MPHGHGGSAAKWHRRASRAHTLAATLKTVACAGAGPGARPQRRPTAAPLPPRPFSRALSAAPFQPRPFSRALFNSKHAQFNSKHTHFNSNHALFNSKHALFNSNHAQTTPCSTQTTPNRHRRPGPVWQQRHDRAKGSQRRPSRTEHAWAATGAAPPCTVPCRQVEQSRSCVVNIGQARPT